MPHRFVNMINIRQALDRDISQLEQLFLITKQQTFSWRDAENFKIEDYQHSTKSEKVFVAEQVGIKLLEKAVLGFLKPLTLKVVTYNDKACKFYEKQGWVKLSTHDDDIPSYHFTYIVIT